jgi:hypothetical protein
MIQMRPSWFKYGCSKPLNCRTGIMKPKLPSRMRGNNELSSECHLSANSRKFVKQSALLWTNFKSAESEDDPEKWMPVFP